MNNHNNDASASGLVMPKGLLPQPSWARNGGRARPKTPTDARNRSQTANPREIIGASMPPQMGSIQALTQAPDFQRMPSALREQPRWVTAKDKKPFMATLVCSGASVTDPNDWATFQEAQTAYEEGGWQGVGFVFNGDGIVGVDLDDCVTDGIPSPEAIAILDELGCGYIEYSQSGNGLHAYGYHHGPCLSGKRGLYRGIKVELYSKGRFFVVTGHVWRDGCLPVLACF